MDADGAGGIAALGAVAEATDAAVSALRGAGAVAIHDYILPYRGRHVNPGAVNTLPPVWGRTRVR
jgi:hypothetical protein